LAANYFVRPKSTLLGEILANNRSSPEAGTVSTITNRIITREVSSGEFVGMLGFHYRIRERVVGYRPQTFSASSNS